MIHADKKEPQTEWVNPPAAKRILMEVKNEKYIPHTV